MRILFVAMPNSVHTVRWMSQIVNQGWELYLFSPFEEKPHAKFREITIFGTSPFRPKDLDKSVRYIRWPSIYFFRDRFEKKISHKYKEKALVQAIQSIKPDIIHSLEFQHAGYLTLGAKNKISNKFPTWISTNWGSDIYLFGRLAEHKPKIKAVLANCDYYSCECQRDVTLAKALDFKGEVLPVFPNTGGFDLKKTVTLRNCDVPSARRMILLKGYQHWAGRALVGLQALRQCIDLLEDYTIAISAASPEVQIAAEIFSQDTEIPIEIIPAVAHDEILRYFARSRIYIGLSISDAISTSLLESIVMGAFPIQSCTACADEWIEDGKSGFIVPPEEPKVIADAIRRALTDDSLVDRAAEINEQIAAERLDYSGIQTKVIKMYKDIYDSQKE